MNWIKVKDQRPENLRYVIVCTTDRDVYYCNTFQSMLGDQVTTGGKVVTHWMSLPKPPEEE